MEYYRYWNRVYQRQFMERPNHPAWKGYRGCQVPGHQGDKTHRCINKFEKWLIRPNKARQLYWRLHESARRV